MLDPEEDQPFKPHETSEKRTSIETTRIHAVTPKNKPGEDLENSQFVSVTKPRPASAEPELEETIEQTNPYHRISNNPTRIRKKTSKLFPNWSLTTNWLKRLRLPGGCLSGGLIILLIGFVILILGAAIFLTVGYFAIAGTLPSIGDLREHSAQFETTRIVDRENNVLYELLDPNAGRRTYVPLSQISPALVAATIATEDKEFYSHPGFDPVAITKAIWLNIISDGSGPGASTITQQLARSLLLSPEERVERSYTRKIREIILAAEITRKYSKDEILELYLNEIYYGNLSYGIEAAAATYFGDKIDGQPNEINTQGTLPNGRLADDLTIAQASFLAGLPQSPAIYDIYTNRDVTLQRNRDVLALMYQLSEERNCITVSNWDQKVCVSLERAIQAVKDNQSFEFPIPVFAIKHPHWVNYIREQLEQEFDAQTIYRSGFTVTTSIDPTLQAIAQQAVREQVSQLAGSNANNGALVSIKPSTGEILAMVGSADFYNVDIQGQVNMAITQTRQPGSSIKPLVYLAAFEKGWSPSTLIWDIPSKFSPSGLPDDPSPAYEPVNYDGQFHGPVTVRSALANSYNIPAVKALDFVGIYDDPNTDEVEGLIGMAEKLGITSLIRDDYGLALSLGGGEVSLLELTNAYSTIAANGLSKPLVSILKITDHQGNVIYEFDPEAIEETRVLKAEHAFLMSSILSDYSARRPMFGDNPIINLPFNTRVAAKTGTTNDFRDNWTVGYSPDVVTGVWVGNADYTAMFNTTGLSGAAPIWATYMTQAIPYLTGGEPSAFERPSGIVERIICALSGTEPSAWCPEQTVELFDSENLPPSKKFDLWQEVRVDTWSGLVANQYCNQYTKEIMSMNVEDKDARKWLKKDEEGIRLAKKLGFDDPIIFTPTEECDAQIYQPKLEFSNLSNGQEVHSAILELEVIASVEGRFSGWAIYLAEGKKPNKDDWRVIYSSENQVYSPTFVTDIQTATLPNGEYSLKLRMEHPDGGFAEKVIQFVLNYTPPTSTPEPTPTITQTPEPTATEEIIPTATEEELFPTPTFLPSQVPSDTPEPTASP